jgi:hypothetical protein
LVNVLDSDRLIHTRLIGGEMQNATARPLEPEERPSGPLSPLRPAKVTWAELGCPIKVRGRVVCGLRGVL